MSTWQKHSGTTGTQRAERDSVIAAAYPCATELGCPASFARTSMLSQPELAELDRGPPGF